MPKVYVLPNGEEYTFPDDKVREQEAFLKKYPDAKPVEGNEQPSAESATAEETTAQKSTESDGVTFFPGLSSNVNTKDYFINNPDGTGLIKNPDFKFSLVPKNKNKLGTITGYKADPDEAITKEAGNLKEALKNITSERKKLFNDYKNLYKEDPLAAKSSYEFIMADAKEAYKGEDLLEFEEYFNTEIKKEFGIDPKTFDPVLAPEALPEVAVESEEVTEETKLKDSRLETPFAQRLDNLINNKLFQVLDPTTNEKVLGNINKREYRAFTQGIDTYIKANPDFTKAFDNYSEENEVIVDGHIKNIMTNLSTLKQPNGKPYYKPDEIATLKNVLEQTKYDANLSRASIFKHNVDNITIDDDSVVKQWGDGFFKAKEREDKAREIAQDIFTNQISPRNIDPPTDPELFRIYNEYQNSSRSTQQAIKYKAEIANIEFKKLFGDKYEIYQRFKQNDLTLSELVEDGTITQEVANANKKMVQTNKMQVAVESYGKGRANDIAQIQELSYMNTYANTTGNEIMLQQTAKLYNQITEGLTEEGILDYTSDYFIGREEGNLITIKEKIESGNVSAEDFADMYDLAKEIGPKAGYNRPRYETAQKYLTIQINKLNQEQLKYSLDQVVNLKDKYGKNELDKMMALVEPINIYSETLNKKYEDLENFGEITTQDDVRRYNKLLAEIKADQKYGKENGFVEAQRIYNRYRNKLASSLAILEKARESNLLSDDSYITALSKNFDMFDKMLANLEGTFIEGTMITLSGGDKDVVRKSAKMDELRSEAFSNILFADNFLYGLESSFANNVPSMMASAAYFVPGGAPFAMASFFNMGYSGDRKARVIAKDNAEKTIKSIEEQLKSGYVYKNGVKTNQKLGEFELFNLNLQLEEANQIANQNEGVSQLLSIANGSADLLASRFIGEGFIAKNLNKLSLVKANASWIQKGFAGLRTAGISEGMELLEETSVELFANLTTRGSGLFDGVDSQFVLDVAVGSKGTQAAAGGRQVTSSLINFSSTSKEKALQNAQIEKIVDITKKIDESTDANDLMSLKKEKLELLNNLQFKTGMNVGKLANVSATDLNALNDIDVKLSNAQDKLSELISDIGVIGKNGTKRQQQILQDTKEQINNLNIQKDAILDGANETKQKEAKAEKASKNNNYKTKADIQEQLAKQEYFNRAANDMAKKSKNLNRSEIAFDNNSEAALQNIREQYNLSDADFKKLQEGFYGTDANGNLLSRNAEGLPIDQNGKIVKDFNATNAFYIPPMNGNKAISISFTSNQSLAILAGNKIQGDLAAVSDLHEVLHHENRAVGIIKDGKIIESAKNAVNGLDVVMQNKLEEGKITQEIYDEFKSRKDSYDQESIDGVDYEETINLVGDLIALGHISKNDFTNMFGYRLMMQRLLTNGTTGKIARFLGVHSKIHFNTTDQVFDYISNFTTRATEGRVIVDTAAEEEDAAIKESKVNLKEKLADLVSKKKTLIDQNKSVFAETKNANDPTIVKNKEAIAEINEQLPDLQKNVDISNKNEELINQLEALNKEGDFEDVRARKSKVFESLLENNKGILNNFINSDKKGVGFKQTPGSKVTKEQFTKYVYNTEFNKLLNTYMNRDASLKDVPFGAYLQLPNTLNIRTGNILKQLQKGEAVGRMTSLDALMEKGVDPSTLMDNDDSGATFGESEAVELNDKGIKLKDELNVPQDVIDNIQERASKLDASKLNYKNLKDLAPEFTNELFGVKPKPGDLNQPDIENFQEWISKSQVDKDGNTVYPNAELIRDLLPEGTIPYGPDALIGKSTGVQNVLLEQFYDAEQISPTSKKQKKRSNIEAQEILEFFGVNIDGDNVLLKENRKLSQRVKAAIAQTGKALTNQVVRETAQIKSDVLISDQIAAGKSNLLASKMAISLNPETFQQYSKELPKLGQALDKVNVLDKKSVRRAVESVYSDILTKPQITQFVTDLTKDKTGILARYDLLGKNYKEVKAELFDINEFIEMETVLTEQAAENNLKNILGVEGDRAAMLADNVVVNRVRKTMISDYIAELDQSGMSDVEIVKTVLALQSMHASAGKIGKGSLSTNNNPGGDVEAYTGEARGPRQSGQITEGNADFFALVKNGSPRVHDLLMLSDKGSVNRKKLSENLGANLENYSEKSSDVLNEINKGTFTFEGRKQQALDNRTIVKNQLEFLKNKIDEGVLSKADALVVFGAFGSNMESPSRKAAYAAYAAVNANDFTNPAQDLAYDHMKPHNVVMNQLAQAYFNETDVNKRNAAVNEAFNDYVVGIIPESMDKLITRMGMQYNMQPGYDPKSTGLSGVLGRLYNSRTLGGDGVVAVRSLDTKDIGTDREIIGQDFVKLSEAAVEDGIAHDKRMVLDKAINNSRNIKESRGASVFDFDETLIIDGENFVVATKDGETVRIPSDKWPIDGPRYEAEGYTFDFSDFVNVRGGKDGPLLQKMKNQIAKYGPNNVFVLTARMQEAAGPINQWLKSKGIDIPFNNITGLGDSKGDAKAEWMVNKYAEGYNDMYFVDDALPNVEAVQHVFDQLDMKGKAVQARAKSSKLSIEFNEILFRTKGVEAFKDFSRVEARRRGGEFYSKLLMPPSAEDFEGLLYYFAGKGKQGEADFKFLKENLLDPFAKADSELDHAKQTLMNDYKQLNKTLPVVSKKLRKKIPGTNFTYDQAVRVYLWNKAGVTIPGLADASSRSLTEIVARDEGLTTYALGLERMSKVENGLPDPSDTWDGETIGYNVSKLIGDYKRKQFLADWIDRKNQIFTPENLNKIEATYGTEFRDAMENMLYRMENGTNRVSGGPYDKIVNPFLNFLNGSIGNIMFFNSRSAVLQTLSTVNYIDFENNNIFKAGKAFANQKQFWSDFSFIFNSDMLKQRRSGLQTNIESEELASAVAGKKNKAAAAVKYLLKIGFAPTQIADSFAIAMGGSSYYRNQVQYYLDQGATQADAEEQAFQDFQEKTEATQQSSRPDRISQQQASPLGRLILAFQNTPMQYNRIMKKAALDLINRRGNDKANLSRIAYYGAMQNFIFNSMQNAAFAMLGFDDDEDEVDEKEMKRREQLRDKKWMRIGNGMVDSILRGSGWKGAVLASLKNTIMKFQEEEDKDFRQRSGAILVEALNVSPPIGSKARKVYGALETYRYNKNAMKEMSMFDVDNPAWGAAANVFSAATNAPVDRFVRKVSNLNQALNTENTAMQRVFVALGWDQWGLDIQGPRVKVRAANKAGKLEVKEQQREERQDVFLQDQKKEKQEVENITNESEKKEKKEQITCAAASRSGTRCKNKPVDGTYCTVHQKVEQRQDKKQVRCKGKNSAGQQCGMMTTNKSGFCYYHD